VQIEQHFRPAWVGGLRTCGSERAGKQKPAAGTDRTSSHSHRSREHSLEGRQCEHHIPLIAVIINTIIIIVFFFFFDKTSCQVHHHPSKKKAMSIHPSSHSFTIHDAPWEDPRRQIQHAQSGSRHRRQCRRPRLLSSETPIDAPQTMIHSRQLADSMHDGDHHRSDHLIRSRHDCFASKSSRSVESS
jgi:hypothetical protein